MPPSPAHPPSSALAPRRVAIIGGGISGLAAAHRVQELDPTAQITLFEASGRLGGILHTERRDGWLIERSADMFTTREPWALDLCHRLGIADQLIPTDGRFRRACVVRRGRLVPVPAGFTLMSPARIWPVVKTPLLSPLGKLRLAREPLVSARKDTADESLESFVVRRMGREAFDRLVQPLIGGIYTADPSKLSMQATMPQFVEMERKFGSLIRGMRAGGSSGLETRGSLQEGKNAGSGARYGLFLAPRDGMQTLIDALVARLPAECVRLNAPVERIELKRDDDIWNVKVRGEADAIFSNVILATPATISSRLLETVDGELASLIAAIPHAGCSVALLGVRREKIAHKLDGFGFVVPAIENRQIIAGSFASIKFAGRAPDGHVLVRVFVGGALQPELTNLPEESIRSLVLKELSELIGLADEPEFFEVARWDGMMPQYHVGHLDRVGQIERRAALLPHFAFAGNAYRGVGIPFCIHSGELAAERIVG